MLIIPVGNYCRICQTLFCCEKCRSKHEDLKHPAEMEVLHKEEVIKSKCFICNGLQLPFNTAELMERDMLQHIVIYHLPLQCDKCLKRFDTAEDFELVGKCCNKQNNEPSCKENMGEEINLKRKIDEAPAKNSSDQENEAEHLTPLTKLNLRWRRKSREFGKPVNGKAVARTHSTPFQESFDSPPLQMSSIKYTSTSSEADIPSPPTKDDSVVQKPPPTAISPKNKKSSVNRQKPPPNNTPLRQVMTKSIQRAFATHGHYKNFNIKQRRMTYESTSSSYELTVSLLKVDPGAIGEMATPKNKDESSSNSKPLDLRLSPALRRDMVALPSGGNEIRRTQSDTSIITNYVSCASESVAVPKEILNDESDSSGSDDGDEIFYTPRRWVDDGKTEQSFVFPPESEGISAAAANNNNNLEVKNEKGLRLPNFAMVFRRAADYLSFIPTKLASGVSSIEENVLKRRRVSSESSVEPVTSPTPLIKKRRIQGRRPIKRMQNLSYD